MPKTLFVLLIYHIQLFQFLWKPKLHRKLRQCQKHNRLVQIAFQTIIILQLLAIGMLRFPEKRLSLIMHVKFFNDCVES